jgi:hypothetical protein
MVVTLKGISIDVNDEQCWKATWPMVVTVEGILIVVNDEQ